LGVGLLVLKDCVKMKWVPSLGIELGMEEESVRISSIADSRRDFCYLYEMWFS
jgi:hypothetical protein